MNKISDTYVGGEKLDLDYVSRYRGIGNVDLAILRDGLSIPQYHALQNGEHLQADIRGRKKFIYELCVLWKNEMNRPASHVAAHLNHENMVSQYTSRLKAIAASTIALESERLAIENLCGQLQAQGGNLSNYRGEVIQLKENLDRIQQRTAALRIENEARKLQREQLEADIVELKNRIQVTTTSNAEERERINAEIRITADLKMNRLLNEYTSS